MFCEVSQTSEEYKKKFSQFYFCTCKKNHFGCDVDVFISHDEKKAKFFATTMLLTLNFITSNLNLIGKEYVTNSRKKN
jgi:hypothetical protein